MSKKILEYSLFAFAVVVACLGVLALLKTATTSGRIDYCYVDNITGQTGGYEVVGHRPWSRNSHIGVSGSPEGANDIIKNSVSCPK